MAFKDPYPVKSISRGFVDPYLVKSLKINSDNVSGNNLPVDDRPVSVPKDYKPPKPLQPKNLETIPLTPQPSDTTTTPAIAEQPKEGFNLLKPSTWLSGLSDKKTQDTTTKIGAPTGKETTDPGFNEKINQIFTPLLDLIGKPAGQGNELTPLNLPISAMQAGMSAATNLAISGLVKLGIGTEEELTQLSMPVLLALNETGVTVKSAKEAIGFAVNEVKAKGTVLPEDVKAIAVKPSETLSIPPKSSVPEGISKPLQPLAQEAQKYKSAEEFVNSRKIVYHGTTDTSASAIEKNGFRAGSEEISPLSSRETGLSFTTDKATAQEFANHRAQQSGGKPVIMQVDITDVKNPDVTKYGNGDEIYIPVKEIGNIKTKSQLTDIYNQATKGDETISKTPDQYLPPPPEPLLFQKDGSVTLASGLDLGIDKFIKEDVKPALTYAKTAMEKVGDAFVALKNVLVNWIEPAKPVETKLGGVAYSSAMRAIHTPEAEMVKFENARSNAFDANFLELEKTFDKFTKEQIKDFNLKRGNAVTAEGQALQREAKIPPELDNPRTFQAMKEASDYVYKYAKDNGMNLNYFEDYFYGVFKGGKAKIEPFLDYWKSSTKYAKEKTIPTIADAQAFGLELKNPNPITNIRSELRAIAYRVGLEKLNKGNEGLPFQVEYANANPTQLKNWKAIQDPVFAGKLYDPVYADFVNSLISTNKVTSTKFLKGLRQTTYVFQQIKFFGSVFHMFNELKGSVSDEAGGIFNPKGKGFTQFGRSFKSIDKTNPDYIDYVNIGGGHKYSLEAQSADQMNRALDTFSRGNLLGGVLRIPGAILQSKYIVASPGYVHWMFDEMIPSLKFNKYLEDVATQEKSLNRSLTDNEKIRIIKDKQNIYGEMNERLFGRSGTVTTALRLVFMAPGYGEGNFRNIARAGYNKGPASFVVNSMITTLVTASIATKILTGNWPSVPQNPNDIRDLFKVKTNLKDGNQDQVMFDMMTYDKDFYSIYGNLATLQPGKIPGQLSTRVSGMVSSPFKTANDMTTIFNGGIVVDWKGDPIYYQTDSLPDKINKFLAYEIGNAAPISASTFGLAKTRGVGLLQSGASAVTGIRPTTSESAKDRKSVQGDLFSMEKEKLNIDATLKKLNKENPGEAYRQAVEFNKKVDEKMKQMNDILGNEEFNRILSQWKITIPRLKLRIGQ